MAGMISQYMQRALHIAREAEHIVSPNPIVGAVVVAADGTVAGEGVTQAPPGPHAEVVALEAAGEKARGGAIYVTLEPCAFHGRTPPCVDAIIAAGVAEVHFSVSDVDVRTAGKGQAALEAAGIKTVVGEGEEEARRINEAFFKHRTTGLPFVIAKFASSLDGRIASASGDARWVSGPESRAWAHQLRTRIDAILVGSETVIADDPLLTARPEEEGEDARQPIRIVLDTRGRTPPMAQVFTGPAPTVIVTSKDAPAEWRSAIEARGAEVLALPVADDRIDLRALLEELGRRDVVLLLVEGGAVVLGSFFDAGFVDKVHAIVAPMIVGAAEAPAAVAGRGAYRMADALRLAGVTVENLGEDLLITGYPQYPDADADADA